ncbi:hypothetical protein ACQKP8_26220 [Photobacterium alginatilyticum]|uniref:hypothetical protein n=1 Tax=Photobacterium alginatilyticum TaxID=1775171 RepID=UPI0040693457
MELADLATVVATGVAILTACGTVAGISYRLGQKSALNDIKRIETTKLMKCLYIPLRNSILDVHFTTYEIKRYPRFRDRLSNAIDEFFKRKKLKAKFRLAFNALSDHGISETIEIDTNFPLEKIKSIIENNPNITDKKILEHIQTIIVMTSSPWDYDESDIVKEQHDLATYILKAYEANIT